MNYLDEFLGMEGKEVSDATLVEVGKFLDHFMSHHVWDGGYDQLVEVLCMYEDFRKGDLATAHHPKANMTGRGPYEKREYIPPLAEGWNSTVSGDGDRVKDLRKYKWNSHD